MRKQVLLIYNPSSGKNGARSLLPKIVQNLRQENCRVVVYPILKDFGAEEILMAEKGNFDCVVCCGGDGTLNHTINGLMLMENRPTLGYFPTGSTNDFAASMGISTNVKNACKAIAYNEPFYYDIGKFNDNYFNYVAAFGAFTEVSYSTPQSQKNYLGHAAYIMEGLKHLPIGVSHSLTAKANGQTYSGNYIYGSVTNSTSVGGFSIAKGGDVLMNDGLFEVILIKAPTSVLELQSVVTSVLTQNFDNPYIEYFKTDKIEFEFESPVSWTLDGEFGGELLTADINVVEKAVGILK